MLALLYYTLKTKIRKQPFEHTETLYLTGFADITFPRAGPSLSHRGWRKELSTESQDHNIHHGY